MLYGSMPINSLTQKYFWYKSIFKNVFNDIINIFVTLTFTFQIRNTL